MKNRFFEFITKSNQILLFIASILIIVVITSIFIRETFPTKYESPKVELVKTDADSSKLVVTEYKKEYVVNVRDIHIIKITSSSIKKPKQNRILTEKSFNMFSSDNNENSIVNLMFVKEGTSNHLLFERDVLITVFNIASFDDDIDEYVKTPKLSRNIYSVVDEDSNDDGYLGHDDRNNLYVSEYDGSKINLILRNISRYRVIKDDLILIFQMNEKTQGFYLYNVKTAILNQLNTDMSLANAPS